MYRRHCTTLFALRNFISGIVNTFGKYIVVKNAEKAVSEAKSRTIAYDREAWQQAKEQGGRPETFDLLGFIHYCTTTRKGGFGAGRQTSWKKFN
jgi:hypothetical protein